LLQNISRLFHALTDFGGELLGLANHAAGNFQQLAIDGFHSVLGCLRLATSRPANLDQTTLHASPAVA
jgi:hypothetical protein